MEFENNQTSNLKQVYSDKVKKTDKEKRKEKRKFSKIRNLLKRTK